MKFNFNIVYLLCNGCYFDSDISIWLSASVERSRNVDPLAQERPWLSPYNYCQWNPVGRVDPTGALDGEILDGFTIDRSGNIQRVDNTGGNEYDVLYNKADYDAGKRDYDESGTKSGIKIDRNEIVSFEKKKIPIKDQWENDVVGETTTYKIELSSPTAAKNLFEFLAPLKFEISHQWYLKENKTLNVLYTALQETTVPGCRQRALNYKSQGWSLYRDDHNHPNNDPNPSGYNDSQSGDIPYKNLMLKDFSNTVEYNIFTPANRKYYKY